VPGELLLDTGALIGVLDRSQSVHRDCAAFFESWNGPVVTTEAVLTEASHLLSGFRSGPSICVEFILRAGILLIPSTDLSLRRCKALLDKYADIPMDFADATLVVVAEELNTDLVFTVDDDFRIYRIRSRKPFRLVPS
jgi:predicted nucleic acid-binding protein